ncbi:MAG TPA: DUF6702 family protein [Gemmatimonadales bacterium]
MNAAWLLAGAVSCLLAGHPMHSSGAELSEERDGGVRVVLRVFADDFAAALVCDSAAPAPDRPAAYLRDRFVLLGGSGGRVELAWEAERPSGDVLILHGRGRVPGGLAGVRIANHVLTERFADQVNVVRASYDGRSATLIFVRGDGLKPLP